MEVSGFLVGGLETALNAQEVVPPLLDRYRQRGVINPERPASPSFYTGKHSLNDIVLELEEKLQFTAENSTDIGEAGTSTVVDIAHARKAPRSEAGRLGSI